MEGASSLVAVPVEHRLLGLDRRTFPFGVFVVAVFLLFAVVVPRVDAAITWDDPVAAGDELALSSTVVVAPPTGWNIEAGYRTDGSGPASQSGEATVTGAGVVADLVPDSFDGTPAQLLAQIEKVTTATDDPTFRVDGAPTTTTTDSGEVGVLQPYSSVRGDGVIAAFVIDGTGVEVTAYGPPAQLRAAAPQIDGMIASIRATDSRGDS